MRLRYCFLGLCLVFAPSAFALEVAPPPVLAPLKQQEQAAQLSAQFLTRLSYKPVPLDDTLSANIMNRFINSLDPDRVFFQQADIDRFMSNSAKIDDAIKREDLQIPFSIFNIYEQRVVDRMNYARGLLKEKFDFGLQED